MRGILLLILFCLGWVTTILAETTDSLSIAIAYERDASVKAKLMYRQAHLLAMNGQNGAKDHLLDGLAFASKHGLEGLVANFHHLIAFYSFNQQNFGEAYYHYSLAHRQFNVLNEPLFAARSAAMLGRLALNSGDLAQANHLYQEARVTFLALDSKIDLAAISYHLGYYYHAAGNWEKALAEVKLSAVYYSQLGDSVHLSELTNLLGYLHQKLGNEAMAVAYYHEALQMANTLPDANTTKAQIYNNMGLLLHEQNRVLDAEKAFQQGISLLKDQSWALNDRIWVNYGRLLLQEERFQELLTELPQRIPFQTLWSEDQVGLCEIVVAAYAALGKHQKAWEWEKRRNTSEVSKAWSMSQFSGPRGEEMRQAHQEIVQIETANAQKQKNRMWVMGAVSLACVLMLVLWVSFMRLRYYRRKAKEFTTHWPTFQVSINALEDAVSKLG